MGQTATAQRSPAPAKPAAKPKPDKAANFARLGSKRVRRAVKALDGVAKLANRANYAYTPEQAQKVMRRLAEAIEVVDAAFAGQVAVSEEFTL